MLIVTHTEKGKGRGGGGLILSFFSPQHFSFQAPGDYEFGIEHVNFPPPNLYLPDWLLVRQLSQWPAHSHSLLLTTFFGKTYNWDSTSASWTDVNWILNSTPPPHDYYSPDSGITLFGFGSPPPHQRRDRKSLYIKCSRARIQCQEELLCLFHFPLNNRLTRRRKQCPLTPLLCSRDSPPHTLSFPFKNFLFQNPSLSPPAGAHTLLLQDEHGGGHESLSKVAKELKSPNNLIGNCGVTSSLLISPRPPFPLPRSSLTDRKNQPSPLSPILGLMWAGDRSDSQLMRITLSFFFFFFYLDDSDPISWVFPYSLPALCFRGWSDGN